MPGTQHRGVMVPSADYPWRVLASASLVCLWGKKLGIFLCAFVSLSQAHFNIAVVIIRRKYRNHGWDDHGLAAARTLEVPGSEPT